MRLREKIRPPERFNQEQFSSPCPQKPLREPPTPDRPRFIPFNSNLPPAAFPTLDNATPPTRDDGQEYERGRHVSTSMPAREHTKSGHRGEKKLEEDAMACLQNHPPETFENLIASNGELNPVYMRNMAVLATMGRESPIDGAMADSDIDEVMLDASDEDKVEIPSPTLQPKWSDLSPQIQVEIVNNMLRDIDWLTMCHLLGLTAEEREEVQKNILLREQQAKQEDLHLEEMRAKQLRALLRTDNTTRGYNRVPHQGVFSKISRRFSGKLQDTFNSDFLLCHANEVLDAKLFLCTRGVDRKYAGEWSSGISAWWVPEDHDFGLRLEGDWKSEPCAVDFSGLSANGSAHGAFDADAAELPTRHRVSSTSMTARYCPNPARNWQLHKGDVNCLLQWRPNSHQTRPERVYYNRRENGLLCLGITEERFAQYSDTRWKYVKPEWTFRQPPLDWLFHEKPPPSLEKLYGLNRSKPVSNKPQQAAFVPSTRPSETNVGGNGAHSRGVHTASSLRVVQRHEGLRSEVQRRAPAMQNSDRMYVTFSESGQTSSPTIWSPQATPEKTVSLTGSDCLSTGDRDRSPPANTKSPIPLDSKENSTESSDHKVEHFSNDDPGSDSCSQGPAQLEFTEERISHTNEENNSGDDGGEDEQDEDEVVLLPVSAFSRATGEKTDRDRR
ncbi:uncharacterized protein BO80DRAFT_479524 [Aspergillus ibericus CBS 121593]|uniref:Uncharacterized protein n=1 Tax=Aspergillus ibericus CBS 121593 TaxID=1448316 RepID=A0A395GSR4_9EURO|nr:hypothetical protein BO80DRAFT_479524 [Aspergillus ibericus CBS 121593]RAK98631.1 hypothetical protein BO80DRAFT_479524 [Aspergillus ibericus CBS 121593]